MSTKLKTAARQGGFTLLEVLVSLVILVFGVLGLIGLQAFTQISTFESYQRGQALILAQDMADRIATNRGAALCYNVTTSAGTGVPFAGMPATNPTPTCTAAVGTASTRAVANADLAAWDAALKGVSEQTGGAQVGGLLGARGCVTYDATTNSYRVGVAWQGMAATVAPTAADAGATCALNQYGPEAQRRQVSVVVRIANLN
jgi:type IV pilus assembly protein PilV